MSSFASEPARSAACVVLALLCACARPAPRERPVGWSPQCLRMDAGLGADAGPGRTARSLHVEVWESAESGISCAHCRTNRASCTLLEERCIDLPGPTAIADLDDAVTGMTARASDGPVCVHVIATAAAACAGLECEGRDCVDAFVYCANGITTLENVNIGVTANEVCVDSDATVALMHLEDCLGRAARDAGVPLDAARALPDAGDARPPPMRDTGPSDARMIPDAPTPPMPRDAAGADGCPPTLPFCRDR